MKKSLMLLFLILFFSGCSQINYYLGGADIKDNIISENFTWSSQKINNTLNDYVPYENATRSVNLDDKNISANIYKIQNYKILRVVEE